MGKPPRYVISVKFVPVPGWERRYEEGMAAFLKMLQYARNVSSGSIQEEKRQEDQCLRGSSERPTR